MFTVVESLSYILPKFAKTREPRDRHCVLWCTHKSYYIHNTIPLDNPKNHTVLPYITWGLIRDIKIKKEIQPEIKFEDKAEISQLTKIIGLPFRMSKIRERISMWTKHEERRKILVVKLIVESASENRKSESSNSSVGDELKFKSSKFITCGMDKGNRIEVENNAPNKDKEIIG